MKFVNKNDFVLEDYKLEPLMFLDVRLEQPKPIIFDIRSLEESNKGTFIGAHQLPAEQLEERLIQLPPFGTIIVYSDSQNTGVEDSLKMLWENGFSEILYVDGGLNAIHQVMVSVSEDFEKNFPAYSKENSDLMRGALKLEIYGYDYAVSLVKDLADLENHFKISYQDFDIYFEPKCYRLIQNTKIDWKDGQPSVYNPRMDLERPQGSVQERVQNVLDEMINPSIAMHGGFVTLLEIDKDTAYIEMGGGCKGCGMSHVTLKNGIESTIFDHVPEITQILDVTDHASGQNPYYRAEA